MFCPTGPSASASSGTPGSVSFTGLSAPVEVLVNFSGLGKVNVSFLDASNNVLVDFDMFTSVPTVLAVPLNAASLIIQTSGGGAVASVVAGNNLSY